MLSTIKSTLLAALGASMICMPAQAAFLSEVHLPVARPMLQGSDISTKSQQSFDKIGDKAIVSLLPKNNTTSMPSPRKTYGAFNSVAIPVGKIAAFGQWWQISSQTLGLEGCSGGWCANTKGQRLWNAVQKARTMPVLEGLSYVNRAVNTTIAYRSDTTDHWSSLLETVSRGSGDCEDFAIAKMALLSAMGYPSDDLQLIVIKDTRRQLYHAVLGVHENGKTYILDNLSNTVVSDTRLGNYMPLVSFSGNKSFLHGFASGNATAIALSGKIEPGSNL